MAKKAQYEERKGDNSVEEDIDGRILELLGLEDVVDFTYSEYKTLLREKMVAGRMPGQSGMSNEDVELLTDEFKRVKSKTGIFVIRANRPEDLSDDTGPKLLTGRSDYEKVISPSDQEESDQEEDEKDSFLTSIPLALENITNVLRGVNDSLRLSAAIEEETLELQKEKDLKEQREKEEKESEKKKGILGFIFPKIKEPVVSFVDRIKDFVKNIAIGSVLLAVLKWIKDPKNQEAIDNAVELIVDNAPLILGGLLALALLPVASTLISLTGTIIGLTKALAAATIGLGPAFAALAVVVGGLILIDRSRNAANAQIDRENKRREEEGLAPMTPKEEADFLSRPMEIAETAVGSILPGISDRDVEGLGPSNVDTSNVPKLDVTEDSETGERVIRVPWNPVNKVDVQNYQLLFQKALTQTKPGDKTEIIIEGVGSYKRSRGLFGIPIDSYYDEKGNKLMTKRDFYEHIDERTEEIIKQNKGKPNTTPGTPPQTDLNPEVMEAPNTPPQSSNLNPEVMEAPATPSLSQPDTGMEPQDMQEPQLKVSSMPDNVQKSTEIEPPSLKKSSVTPPKPPRAPLVSVVTVPRMSGGSTSGSRARTSTIPTIGAVDKNNDTMVITKSLYNIIA